MKKRITRNKIALSLSVFLFMLSCFLLVFNFLKANAEEVFLTDEITVSDFDEDDFDYYSGERKSFAFLNEKKDYEATLVSEEAFQGNYSVSFSFDRLQGADKESMQMIVVLGDDDYSKVTIDHGVSAWNTANDDSVILFFTGTKCYIFDRGVANKDANGNPAPNPKYAHNPDGVDTLGSPFCKLAYEFYSKKGISLGDLNVKLSVNTDGAQDVLNFYFSKTNAFETEADYSVNLHKKGVADGYLKFSQKYCQYEGCELNQFAIKNVKKDGVYIDGLTPAGDLSKIKEYTISPYKAGLSSYRIYDSEISNEVNPSIVSSFAIDDAEINDNEKVFEMRFKMLRFAAEDDTHTWGVAFGTEDKELSSCDKLEIKKTGYVDINSIICVYQCTSSGLTENLQRATISYKITGYKGGRLIVEYSDNKETCPKNHSIEYMGVDFNGKFGFFIFNQSPLEGSYLEISDFTFSGSANRKHELNLSIEHTDERMLIVGDSVRLHTNMDTTLEIVKGEQFASLSSNVLTANAAGIVTVRATSVDNEKLYADFDIEIKDDKNYDVNYQNSFFGSQNFATMQNACDFIVTSPTGSDVSINHTLIFANVYGKQPALVTYNVPFTANYSNNTVFDISFVVKSSSRDFNYYFGVAFGQETCESKPLSAGTNALVINAFEAKVYKDGAIVAPTYVTKNEEGAYTQYEKDDFGCYCSELCPLTVRLVGKADGTLEYYRGITYTNEKGITKYTSIDDLFATYSGFDFEGYISLFSEATALSEEYLVEFDDLTIKGNYRNENGFIPEIVDLGIENESQFNLLHSDKPIELKYYVYTKPNLDLYKGIKVEVVSGNAEIDANNNLVTKGAGKVYVKVSSTVDTSKFKIFELDIGSFEISDIIIDETIFENLNTDSQEVLIIPRVQSSTSLSEYLGVKVEVVEGNVEIINNYMYVRGAGKVTLRFYSEYKNSVEKIVTFNIADADIQYENTSGCSSTLDCNFIIVSICIVAVVLFIAFRRKKGDDYENIA